MARKPVVIQDVPADVAARIADEMVELTQSRTPDATDGEAFEPHMNNAASPNLGPRRPSRLPPKPTPRYRTFDDIN
ncbi:MAG: hypothetical protein SFW65_00300 [Alphaproteobacteria bacterium]|nr:hypothetical protein [Alphaproteobacteria bacterium]